MPAIKKVWERDNASTARLERIQFMRDVTGGTKHMRDVAKDRDYLPQFPKESAEDYKTRLKITVFEPFTSDAAQAAKGKIFSKKLGGVDTLPVEFTTYGILKNFDRNGSTINEFAADVAEKQITEGIVFIYTAFPRLNMENPPPSTSVRPYARIVTGDSIISTKYITENGRTILKQVVIEESINQINKDDGEFGQSRVKQYRRIFINVENTIQYIVYRKGANGEETPIETGIIRIAGQAEPEIPLEPCYGIKKGYLKGVSPFEELGYLNIEHFQKMSDYNMSYHLSGANTPVVLGSIMDANPPKDKAVQQQTQVGGAEILNVEQGGDFKWVSGSSDIEKMYDHILKREDRMKAMGFDVIDDGQKTATEINDERADKEAKLVYLANNLENAINRTILHMAEYLNITLTDEQRVTVNKDFNLTVMPIEDFKELRASWNEGNISGETFFKESQKGERLLTIESIEDELSKTSDM